MQKMCGGRGSHRTTHWRLTEPPACNSFLRETHTCNLNLWELQWGQYPAKLGHPEFWRPNLCSGVSRRQDNKPKVNFVPESLIFSLFSLGNKWYGLIILLSYASLSEWEEGLPVPVPLFSLRILLELFYRSTANQESAWRSAYAWLIWRLLALALSWSLTLGLLGWRWACENDDIWGEPGVECNDQNVCVSPSSYVEILTPWQLGGRALGRLDHEERTFVSEISAQKEWPVEFT